MRRRYLTVTPLQPILELILQREFFIAGWITLQVHSALAIGLTTAVSGVERRAVHQRSDAE